MESEPSDEKDKIDLGLARFRLNLRRTKSTIPIRAKMARAPPMPRTIAVIFCFLRDDGGFLVVPPLGFFIVCTVTLREGPSQEGTKNR
jgi:hypothetical protein